MRFGAVFVPNGAIMEQWIPSTPGIGFEFSPILKPLETFRDQLVVVSNLTRANPGVVEGDHAISAAGFLTGRLPEKNGSGRRQRWHVHRSDHRTADRSGHAVPVARIGDRGLHGLHRRVHQRVQLRVHQHDLVELADDAAADGVQPADGLRAHVRSPRHTGAARRPPAAQPEHPRRHRQADQRDAARARRARSHAARRISAEHPRDRTPHPADRGV